MHWTPIRIAYLASGALHLLLFLIVPLPGPAPVPAPLAVELSVAPAPPPPNPLEPALEERFERVPERPPVAPEPVSPEPEPAGVERTPRFIEVQLPDPVHDEGMLPGIPSPPDGPEEPALSPERRAAIDELLEETRAASEQEDRQRALFAYRILVRERVSELCHRHQPGARLGGADGVRAYLVTFAVRSGGAVEDVRVARAPGAPAVPDGLRPALETLGPLPPPPDGVETPVPFEFRVYYP